MSAFMTNNNCNGTYQKHDDYMTPKSAWENIKQFIPQDKVIWECFYGDGKSGENLRELGFNVIHEDIDFFENNKGDMIVSNPPFTLKKEVFTRLIILDKPFIMISSQQLLFTQYFRTIMKDHNLQLIIPRRRIQFIKSVDGVIVENYKSQCNFDCFYYCYKINLDKDITWLE
tara:strand:+ start:54 stop:569 length:516 start_codon:yes stop_codon:yes gene_type:complete